MGSDVVVVGSINQDLTVLTSRHPRPGETILGEGHFTGAGGKGANQAIAAARQGATVSMMGMVGPDDTGSALVSNLQRAGVDTSSVAVDSEHPTGLAVITVDDEGENSIVVSPGANLALLPEHLDVVKLESAAVVLIQLEIPLGTVEAAATTTGGLLCLNPAPAIDLASALLFRVDVLIPNRHELAVLAASATPSSIEEVADVARSIHGPKAVVVTLGSEGALVVADDTVTHVSAPSVETVDTTGAGDAFCGTLAASLARGSSLIDAVGRATVAGAIATTRPGAQTALPTSVEVDSLLGRTP